MKLSDTQHLILSSASQRPDHAAARPATLKGGAAKKVIDKLLNEKLLQEVRATDEMPVWRRGEDSRSYSLRITKAGLRAIEVEDGTETSDDGPAAHRVEVASDRVKSNSKKDRIVVLLRRPEGATLDVLVKETEWQKHSVRGFLAGTVRKKLKLPLVSEKIDGVRTYRISAAKLGRGKKASAARKA